MPIYTAHLTREHKRETRTIRSTLEKNASYTDPVIGYEKVIIAYPTQVLTADDYQAFRAEVVAKASPEDENWGPWYFNNALENGDCPPPPEMYTPIASPAGRAWRKVAEHYRFLYQDDAYTPFRVFEKWFCTIGNGLEWQPNGHYVSIDEWPAKNQAQMDDDRARLDTSPPRYLEDEAPAVKDMVSLYPLSETNSDIFHIPANVEDSYLLAAVDICNYYLSRPTRYSVAYSPKHQDRAVRFDDNTWQAMVMKDAMNQRSKLEKAYAEIWNLFGTRLNNMGITKQSYIRDDTAFGHFVPGDMVWLGRMLTPEEREAQEAVLTEILAELANEKGGPRM